MGARLRALIADLPRPIQFEALGALLDRARARDLIWLEANSLASAIDDGALPFLLFRANDWVLPVAMRAHSMLVNALRPKHAAAWIAALPFEKHVRELRRRDLNPIVDDARRLVMQPANRSAFSRALREAPVDVRRTWLSGLRARAETWSARATVK